MVFVKQIYSTVETGIFLIQIFLIIMTVAFCIVGFGVDKYGIIIIIFIYQIIATWVLFSYNVLYVNEPLGYFPNDSLAYQTATEKLRYFNFDRFIVNLKQFENGRLASPSDWGYPIYRHILSKFTNNRVDDLLLTCTVNACLYTISSVYVYKLARFFLTGKESKIAALMWGLNGLAIVYNTAGLKETVFVFCVVLAVYYLYKFYYKCNLLDFGLMALFIFFTWFFRYYVSIFIILAMLGITKFKKIFNRCFFLLTVSMIILSLAGIELLSGLMPELSFLAIAREKEMVKSFGTNSRYVYLLNFILAYIGPFPAFIANTHPRNLMMCSYSIMKLFFSFFALYGGYYAVKSKKKEIYPIIMIAACNIMLLVVSGISLDARFAFPTGFLYIILIIYGFSCFNKRKKDNNHNFTVSWPKISRDLIQGGWLIICVVLTWVYNFK
jgi:hypothetical protein